MAIMINCATDWTYDLFMEDASLYSAKPIKGVHCASDASDRERFMTWFKNLARDFKAEWLERYGCEYSNHAGWMGDAFGYEACECLFSDYYKDTYGQRPHLDMWMYVKAVGFYTRKEGIATFCATPVEDAIERAKKVRECEW